MVRMRRAAAAACIGAALLASATGHAAPPDAATLDQRVEQLAEQLRCLVCQNESLADSHADLAMDLKRELREQLAAGHPDEQVVDYLVQRYGDFIRYRPPVRSSTLLLWFGPLLLLLAGLLAAAQFVRRQRDLPPDGDDAPAADGEPAPDPTVQARP